MPARTIHLTPTITATVHTTDDLHDLPEPCNAAAPLLDLHCSMPTGHKTLRHQVIGTLTHEAIDHSDESMTSRESMTFLVMWMKSDDELNAQLSDDERNELDDDH